MQAMGNSSMMAERALVVDDDATLLRALASALEGEVGELRCSRDVMGVRRLLDVWLPDLLLLDVKLPDGDAFDVLEAVRAHPPTPLVVAMSGAATQVEAFHLAQVGVRGYLPKPFTVEELRRVLVPARTEPPELAPQLRQTVGRRPLHEVEQDVRDTLVSEALARTGGSRKGAARLLGISRQLLQHILRRRGQGLHPV